MSGGGLDCTPALILCLLLVMQVTEVQGPASWLGPPDGWGMEKAQVKRKERKEGEKERKKGRLEGWRDRGRKEDRRKEGRKGTWMVAQDMCQAAPRY